MNASEFTASPPENHPDSGKWVLRRGERRELSPHRLRRLPYAARPTSPSAARTKLEGSGTDATRKPMCMLSLHHSARPACVAAARLLPERERRSLNLA